MPLVDRHISLGIPLVWGSCNICTGSYSESKGNVEYPTIPTVGDEIVTRAMF